MAWRHISIRVTDDKKPNRFVESETEPPLLVFSVVLVELRQQSRVEEDRCGLFERDDVVLGVCRRLTRKVT